VLIVESDRGLCGTIAHNLATAGFAEHARVVCRDLRRAEAAMRGLAPFDLVLIDPPYECGLGLDALTTVTRADMLAPHAIVVLEHASREAAPRGPSVATMLEADTTRVYGDTALTVYRASEGDR
jgi:16S rRNA (guanine966-N2)-methyltransferase